MIGVALILSLAGWWEANRPCDYRLTEAPPRDTWGMWKKVHDFPVVPDVDSPTTLWCDARNAGLQILPGGIVRVVVGIERPAGFRGGAPFFSVTRECRRWGVGFLYYLSTWRG